MKHISPLSILILTLHLLFTVCHQTHIIPLLPPIKSQGLPNILLPIHLPQIPLIHSATPLLPENSQHLIITPATVYITPIPHYEPMSLPTNKPTLLEELRSPKSTHYTNIIMVNEYLFLTMTNGKIVIVKEIERPSMIKTFELVNVYTLEFMNKNANIKIYQIPSKEPSVLCIIPGENYVYKLSLSQMHKYKIDFGHEDQSGFEVGHIIFLNEQIFIAAELKKGLSMYRIDNGVHRISMIGCDRLGGAGRGIEKETEVSNKGIEKSIKEAEDILSMDHPSIEMPASCEITDISYIPNTSHIYVLDSKQGLTRFTLTFHPSSPSLLLSKPEIISPTPNCESLDIMLPSTYILLCELGMPNSYIKEIVEIPTPGSSSSANSSIFIEKEPMYHNCNFLDLIVCNNFYLTFDLYSIDVFWGSNESFSNLSPTKHSQQHLNLPGLQVFAVHQEKEKVWMYAVEDNSLFKYELKQFNGSVYAYSSFPISKSIEIEIPTVCNPNKYPVLTLNNEIDQSTTCSYLITIQLEISQHIEEVSREIISMSIGVIVIMIAIVIIITCICTVKYTGLELHARRILSRERDRGRQFSL